MSLAGTPSSPEGPDAAGGVDMPAGEEHYDVSCGPTTRPESVRPQEELVELQYRVVQRDSACLAARLSPHREEGQEMVSRHSSTSMPIISSNRCTKG
jgi:hypothetical protein